MKVAGFLLFGGVIAACNNQSTKDQQEADANTIRLITLDPGHFHAALVQKSMYPNVDSTVHVYAPNDGKDLQAHLSLIDGFNTRATDPTHWKEEVYTGDDYVQKMIEEKKGNVVVLAGDNQRKIDYITQSIDAGFNVLADKPVVIDVAGFQKLEKAFAKAKEKNVLLYDIMTERFEVTTALQKEFSQVKALFGELQKGTTAEPAITKESVHHFFKEVAGKPLTRPSWFFDVTKQGEGIVDVTSHLVDLVQWEGFPEQIIDYRKDIDVLAAKRWPTWLTAAQFKKATEEDFPENLKANINDKGELGVYANGEINYTIKGVHARIIVKWNFEPPKGTGDTHYSIMRGTHANLIIKQGQEQGYKPVLYVEAINSADRNFEETLKQAITEVTTKYKGIGIEKLKPGFYQITIPEELKTVHEQHFGQVTQNYLSYLTKKQLPDWEVPNMLAKYYTTTKALELAKQEK
ncbi:putative oxidoreductase C-terminal domain-containing protein [Olivibacter ginsenosidimutans]